MIPEDDNGMTLRKALDRFQLQCLNVTLFAFHFCVRTLGYRNVTRTIGKKTILFFPFPTAFQQHLCSYEAVYIARAMAEAKGCSVWHVPRIELEPYLYTYIGS